MVLLNIITIILTSDNVYLKDYSRKNIYILIVRFNYICTTMLAMYNDTCISLFAQEKTWRQIYDTKCAQGYILDI